MSQRLFLPAAAALALAAGLSLGADAHADPPAAASADSPARPRLGLELGTTLSSVGGIGARLDLGPVQFDGLFGGQPFQDSTGHQIAGTTLRVLVPIVRLHEGWAGVAAGGTYLIVDNPVGQHVTSWAAEGGLHAEWFALPSLSLGLDLGLVARVDRFSDDSPPTTTERSLALTASVGGAGTITFWF